MTRVPNAREALIAVEKVRDYLLNPDHRDNRGKAGLFTRFGFDRDGWARFGQALADHVVRNEIVEIEPTSWGSIYTVRCNIVSPDGRDPCIRSLWIIKHDEDRPRLITAF